MADKSTRRARYIAGRCVDCGEKPYSPGRPRCDQCHAQHAANGHRTEPQEAVHGVARDR